MADNKKNKRLLLLALLIGGGAYLYLRNKRKQEALMRSQMANADVPEEGAEEELGGGGGGGFGGGGGIAPIEDAGAGDVGDIDAGDDSNVGVNTGGGVTGGGSILNVNVGDTKPSSGSGGSTGGSTTPSWLSPDRPIGINRPDKPKLPPISVSDMPKPSDRPKPSWGRPVGGGILGGIGATLGNIIDGKPQRPSTGGRPIVGGITRPAILQKPPSIARPVVEKKPTANLKAMQEKKQLEARKRAMAMAGKVNTTMRKFADFDGDDMDFGFDD